MKQLFAEHFRESDDDIRGIWQNALFVLDANILLNFYRYSDATRDEFFSLLESIQDRIWLPHRAVEEFFNNRLSVISAQEKAYNDTVSQIEQLSKSLKNSRQHPFVSTDMAERADSLFLDLQEELESNKGIHTARLTDDSIKERIATVFAESVGAPFDEDKLKEIFSLGKERYENKVPPGYKDAGKSKSSKALVDQCREYGDLIVWKQILYQANELNKDIILITDDRKEDWWQQFSGKTIGPRPELIKEFYEVTGQRLLMYQPERFLQLADSTLNTHVSSETVDEVRDVATEDKHIVQFNLIDDEDDTICPSDAAAAEYAMKKLKERSARTHQRKILDDTQWMYESLHPSLHKWTDEEYIMHTKSVEYLKSLILGAQAKRQAKENHENNNDE